MSAASSTMKIIFLVADLQTVLEVSNEFTSKNVLVWFFVWTLHNNYSIDKNVNIKTQIIYQ